MHRHDSAGVAVDHQTSSVQSRTGAAQQAEDRVVRSVPLAMDPEPAEVVETEMSRQRRRLTVTPSIMQPSPRTA
jgi:hypothetical protein